MKIEQDRNKLIENEQSNKNKNKVKKQGTQNYVVHPWIRPTSIDEKNSDSFLMFQDFVTKMQSKDLISHESLSITL